MSTDEEMIIAVRAMSPEELNTFVAMKLVAIVRTQEACNLNCQTRLNLMQEEVGKANKKAQDAQKDVARLSGWMKGIWLIIGGMVAALIGLLVSWRR